MTAPIDHLAAARAEIEDSVAHQLAALAAVHIARAQVHATIALAEEARTANLLSALDYGCGQHLSSDERRAEITARLWPTS